MPDLIERVTRLEARSDERDRTMDYLRAEMIELRRAMESLSTELRGEMAALRESFERRLTWLVGLQVAGLVAVIAALLRR